MGLFRRKPLHERLAEEGGLVEESTVPLFTGVIPEADRSPVDDDELDRLIRILRACWRAFAAAVEAAEGIELRTGPRGGGRDRDKMVAHVAEAELGYIGALGAKTPRSRSDGVAALDEIHEAAVKAVQAKARGELPDEGARGGRRWPAPFFIRRTAWHALDHAWEIEDRAGPQLASGG